MINRQKVDALPTRPVGRMSRDLMQQQLGNTITSRAFNRVPSVDMRKDTLACFRRQEPSPLRSFLYL